MLVDLTDLYHQKAEEKWDYFSGSSQSTLLFFKSELLEFLSGRLQRALILSALTGTRAGEKNPAQLREETRDPSLMPFSPLSDHLVLIFLNKIILSGQNPSQN